MRRLIPALLGALPVLAAGPAFAQATPEGAAALQKGLAAILTPTLATPGLGAPIFEGGWTVEPDGAGYRVTGPALALTLRNDSDGRKRVVRIRCDGDRYTAAPGQGAVYRLHGDMPLRCEIRSGGGEPPVTITSRTRSADLTVDVAASLLIASADESVGVTAAADGKPPFAIDRLRLASATAGRTDSPRQDVAVQVEAEGISAGDPATGEELRLGRLRYSGRLDDIDAVALRDRVWRLVAFALDAAQRDPKAPPPPNAERKLDTLLRRALDLAGSAAHSELALNDMRGGDRNTVVSLDSLTVAGGYRGLDRAAPGSGLAGDATYELRGLKVQDLPGAVTETPGSLSIDRLRLSGILDPVAGARVARSVIAVDLDGMAFALAKARPEPGEPPEMHFGMDHAHYGLSAEGLDVAGLIDVVGGFEAMLAKHDGDTPPPEELSPWFARLRTTLAAFSRYEAEVKVEGFKAGTSEAGVAIRSIAFGEHLSGLDGDQAGYHLSLAADGVSLDPALPYGDWVPREAQIDLSLKDLPSRSIQALLWDGVEAAIAANERHKADPAQPAGDAVFAEMGQRIAARLFDSGTDLSIDSFNITAPKGSVDLAGGGVVDGQAALGVTAQGKLRVVGLPEFVEFLQTQPDGQDAAAGFTVFQTMGRQATTADGRDARDYDIVVDPQGRALVNGTDLAAMAPK